jgi:hypothetical protein
MIALARILGVVAGATTVHFVFPTGATRARRIFFFLRVILSAAKDPEILRRSAPQDDDWSRVCPT